MQREDGRRPDQLRPIEIEPDYLEHPHGSALMTQGKTKVLCTAMIAEEVAREVAETLARKGIENAASREGEYRFLTTGDPVQFCEMGRRFLQLPIASAEHVAVAALEAAA